MKRVLSFGFAVLAATAGFAATTVSNVTLTPNAAGNFVTIKYALSGDSAIVTLDVQTNGVSVGGKCLYRTGGDVNRVVTAGDGDRTIWWRPSADCDVTGENVRAVIHTWTLDNPPDYTAFELTGTKARRFYTSEDALPYGIGSDVYRTGWLLMRRVPATGKTFFAGSAPTEPMRDPISREDAHPVYMTKDYWLGVFEITQGQWDFVCPPNIIAHNSYYTNALCAATRPVDRVWCRILRGLNSTLTYGFSQYLSQAVGNNSQNLGQCFDLPNEAQWEFACRAGTSTSLPSGRWLEARGGTGPAELGVADANLGELARYEANGGRVYPPEMMLPVAYASATGTVPGREADATVATARVGSYKPNAYGLYDMLGNVAEVTSEKFVQYLGNAAVSEIGLESSKIPTADETPVVVKGGNFKEVTYYCRAACRLGPRTAPVTQPDDAFGYGVRMMLPIGK